MGDFSKNGAPAMWGNFNTNGARAMWAILVRMEPGNVGQF